MRITYPEASWDIQVTYFRILQLLYSNGGGQKCSVSSGGQLPEPLRNCWLLMTSEIKIISGDPGISFGIFLLRGDNCHPVVLLCCHTVMCTPWWRLQAAVSTLIVQTWSIVVTIRNQNQGNNVHPALEKVHVDSKWLNLLSNETVSWSVRPLSLDALMAFDHPQICIQCF